MTGQPNDPLDERSCPVVLANASLVDARGQKRRREYFLCLLIFIFFFILTEARGWQGVVTERDEKRQEEGERWRDTAGNWGARVRRGWWQMKGVRVCACCGWV